MAHRPDPLKHRGRAPKPRDELKAATSSRSRTTIGGLMAILAIAVVEFVWLGWFLAEPLPNAGPDRAIRHWMFLARAFPYVIPGVEPGQSYLGMAVGELSHVEFLPQRLPIVLAASLIGLAAVSLGRLALRWIGRFEMVSTLERIPLGFGLGASILSVVTLIAGRFGLLSPWPVRLGLLVPIAVEVGCIVRKRRSLVDVATEDKGKSRSDWGLAAWLGFLAITGPFLLTMMLGAMLPSIDYDAIEYHLQGPKEYYLNGKITFLTHNVYTSMPFHIEMLHLLGMEAMGDWWTGALAGQLLVAVHAPLAAIFIATTAARLGAPQGGWFAALVYLTTPWIYRLAILPYVEGPLCFYQAGLIWGALIAWKEVDRSKVAKDWGIVGALAGGAMACKYPALISAVIPFGLLVSTDGARRRIPKALLAYGIGAAVIMTPWLAKNVIDTGNPVYPLGFSVFGGRHWDAAMDQKWRNAHGPRPISIALLWQSAVDVAGRSDWQSPLYLGLAPLAFLRPGTRRFSSVIAVLIAYIFLTWWLLTHRLDRFWLPLLPASAVLAGLGADWTRSRAWRGVLGGLLGLTIVTNLSYSTTALTGLNEWTADLGRLRKSVPAMLNPALMTLDDEFRTDKKALLVGQAAVFHLNRPIVYNTVFDDEIFEQIAKGQTPETIRARLRERGIDSIYVDWHDINRFRSPGNYGFTGFVQPIEFERLVKAKVLEPALAIGESGQELYRVVGDP